MAITPKNRVLKMTLSKGVHDLDHEGSVMGGWNYIFFSFGVAATLPGLSGVAGPRPAAWTMGNLGEAGYGARLKGTWCVSRFIGAEFCPSLIHCPL